MNQALLPKPARYVGRSLAPAAPTVVEPAAGYSFAFAFFLLLNFVLFVRPMELFTDENIYGLEMYQYVMIVCVALGFPTLLGQLRFDVLEKRPITLCMFGLLTAVLLSHLARFDFVSAGEETYDYSKVVLYFLLFTGLITTTSRLQQLLNVVLWSIIIVAALSVLQFHEIINLPTVETLTEGASKGEAELVRLRGAGMFHDPNDFCVLLAFAVQLGLYRLLDKGGSSMRLLWLGPLALLLTAIVLTRSRGGLLALLVGLAVVLVMRYGKRVGLALVLLIPVALLALGGSRQTDFSTSSGTAQERVQVWADALMKLRSSPLFGIGRNQFTKDSRLVAHNSYLHCFAELGILGGGCFVGGIFLTLRHFYRRRDLQTVRDPEMRRLLPYLGGASTTYCVGMMSLTLLYLVSTGMILALGQVTANLAKTDPELPEERTDLRLLGQLFAVAIVFLFLMEVFVRLAMIRG